MSGRRFCQWRGCDEYATHRMRFHAEDGYQGFTDVCDGHAAEIATACVEENPDTTFSSPGTMRVDADGREISRKIIQ